MHRTRAYQWVLIPGLLGCAFIAAVGVSSSLAAGPARHAGTVVAVDAAAGTLVIEDVGPLLKSGKSAIHRLTVHVSKSAEFTRARRTEGAGPGGWIGAIAETPLPAWQVKDGDYAVVTIDNAKAVKVTVVDAREP
jgi:hypothetical protein